MDSPPKVCGDVTVTSARHIEVALDVAPAACEIHLAAVNNRHEVTITAWNDAGSIAVERVEGAPLPMRRSGPPAVRVAQGRPIVVDLAELRALGYVD